MYEKNRGILRSGFGQDFDSGQKRGEVQPHYVKGYDKSSELVDLPELDGSLIKNRDIVSCFINRETRRLFKEETPMELGQLAYILKMIQGVKKIRKDNKTLKRYVPSASGRHSFETYILVNNVEGLEKAVYRYLPMEEKLLVVKKDSELSEKIVAALNGQIFAARASIVVVLVAVCERMEWRFGDLAHKLILLDGGHIGQNLYLAAESLGLGACAVADYNQDRLDSLLELSNGEISTYIGLCGVRKK